jgi:hypothetical protein
MSAHKIEAVERNSLCHASGVRRGDRILSISNRVFLEDMHRELFPSPERDMAEAWEEYWNCNVPSGQPPLIVLKKSYHFPGARTGHGEGAGWWEEWSFDQEIFNNHLRSARMMIFSIRNGVPCLGHVPLFYTDTLDNFGAFTLFTSSLAYSSFSSS